LILKQENLNGGQLRHIALFPPTYSNFGAIMLNKNKTNTPLPGKTMSYTKTSNTKVFSDKFKNHQFTALLQQSEVQNG